MLKKEPPPIDFPIGARWKNNMVSGKKGIVKIWENLLLGCKSVDEYIFALML